jgi:hypothetical protein
VKNYVKKKVSEKERKQEQEFNRARYEEILKDSKEEKKKTKYLISFVN